MTSIGSSPSEPDQAPLSPNSLFSVDSSELACTHAADPLKQGTFGGQSPGSDIDRGEPACFFDLTSRSIVPFPAIPGLYYLPNLIDHKTETEWMSEISQLNFFNNQSNNQMMFFSRPNNPSHSSPAQEDPYQKHELVEDHGHSFLKWPTFLIDLIRRLPSLLSAVNPDNLERLNDLFFGSDKMDLPWQVILNLYRPGEGIEQHVDLVERFDEIILGISLGSNVAMEFEPVGQHEKSAGRQLYLEQRSGYIISREARYDWTHGIRANQLHDWVCDSSSHEIRKVLRVRTRVSITIRRMKSSADLLKD
jgi:alkylated DNA repair dioxygenase AlkB